MLSEGYGSSPERSISVRSRRGWGPGASGRMLTRGAFSQRPHGVFDAFRKPFVVVADEPERRAERDSDAAG